MWETDYDIYGNLRNLCGDRHFIPFRQLGQIEDEDTGLYYNRFRWYSADTGLYISQDPIRLAGNNPTLYAYTHDTNWIFDVFGLMELFRSMSRDEYFDIIQNGWNGKNNMEAKWFAESYEDAVTFGQTLGHGSDSKFYVVGFEIDDAIVADGYHIKRLDNIGDAVAIDVDKLNSKSTPVTSVNTHKVKYS